MKRSIERTGCDNGSCRRGVSLIFCKRNVIYFGKIDLKCRISIQSISNTYLQLSLAPNCFYIETNEHFNSHKFSIFKFCVQLYICVVLQVVRSSASPLCFKFVSFPLSKGRQTPLPNSKSVKVTKHVIDF